MPSKKQTKTKPKYKEKYVNRRSRRWVMTLHGANDEQLDGLNKLFAMEKVVMGVASREGGEYSMHPHFQVYFELDERGSIRQECLDLFGKNYHLEQARGTKEANVAYVYGMSKAYEIGWIVAQCGEHEVPQRYWPHEAEFMRTFKPRPFQKQIIDIIEDRTPDDRTIYWFWEPKGNTGKSIMASYLNRAYGAVIAGGNAKDIKHAMARVRDIVGLDPTVVVVDNSRSEPLTPTTYTAIESVKNKCFFSGKYESTTINMKKSPDVLVLSNYPPMVGILSLDRWKVFMIDDKTGIAHEQSADEVQTYIDRGYHVVLPWTYNQNYL